jgi:hypothetical protein
MQHSAAPLYISEISFLNFRHFMRADIKNVTATHLIIGQNGAGKTTILWGIILFLHAYNSQLTGSMHKDQPHVTVGGVELSELLNARGLNALPLPNMIRKGNQEVCGLLHTQICTQAPTHCLNFTASL